MKNKIDLSAFGTPLSEATNIVAPGTNNSKTVLILVAVVITGYFIYKMHTKNNLLQQELDNLSNSKKNSE